MTTVDGSARPFQELAEVALTLTAGKKELRLAAAAVTAFGLDLRPSGFEGSVEVTHALDLDGDPLYAAFVEAELLRVDLSVQVADRDFLEGRTPQRLHVRGIATERWMEESSSEDVDGAPVLVRRYRIGFIDPAAALWSQHFPTALRARSSIAQVVKELGQVGGIEVSVDWDGLEKTALHVCVPLGEGEASLRDYVLWLATTRGGSFTYDHRSGGYRLGKEKPEARPARAIAAEPLVDLQRVRAVFPQAPRHDVRIHDAHAERHSRTLVENEVSAGEVVRDVVVRMGISSEVEEVKEREARRVRTPREEIVLPFRRYPDAPVLPGESVELAGAAAAKRFTADVRYRVLALALDARREAPGGGVAATGAPATFRMRMACRLERADDPVPRLPPCRAPRWPVLVEGVVAVDAGKEGERLYAIARDGETAREYTEIVVPVWGERIRVPFQPGFFPGSFYAPPVKGQKVLVALHHERAEIASFLDWADGARLPADGQGNHVLLGKRADAETSIRHRFVDDVPALTVTRRMERDQEVVELSEGAIVLETREDEG